MRWNVHLTAIALEARYLTPRITKRFETSKMNPQQLKRLWEDTVLVFSERALVENAWDDEQPRMVSVQQFKAKLKVIAAQFKKRRSEMTGTGNRLAADSSGEDTESIAGSSRARPWEMPRDFFTDGSDWDKSTPRNAAGITQQYRTLLGNELAAIWPLLCHCFSGRNGCTGEALAETGLADELNPIGEDRHTASPEKAPSESEIDEDVSSDEDDDDARTARARARRELKLRELLELRPQHQHQQSS